MAQLRVVHKPYMAGWWVLEGPGRPPSSRVVSTFGNLAEAVRYVRDHQPVSGPGRPRSGLNDDIVDYALRAAKHNMRRASEILGVNYDTLRRYLGLKSGQKGGV